MPWKVSDTLYFSRWCQKHHLDWIVFSSGEVVIHVGFGKDSLPELPTKGNGAMTHQ